MEITIYPYKVVQRTEYSKIRLIDLDTNKDITTGNETILEKIISDYNKQKDNKEDYFEINNNRLLYLKEAFRKDHIEYLFIPDGVTIIGECAFRGESFTNLSFPNSLKQIFPFGFQGCRKLSCLDIPDTVEEIRANAFIGCLDLKSVKLPNLNKIEWGLFKGCSKLETIHIPDTVGEIGESAFRDCSGLKNVVLSENMKIIYDSAFQNCVSLQKIKLPNTLEKIHASAFSNTGLREIYIPDSVTLIGNQAFSNCYSLKNVRLSENLTYLDKLTFGNCSYLDAITLPDKIETLYDIPFRYTKMTDINIPANLKKAQGFPFCDCYADTLIFNHSIEHFNPYQFENQNFSLIHKSLIEKIVIKKGVERITPDLFIGDAEKIKEIKYLGTPSEFETFKTRNNDLFAIFKTTPYINFSHDTSIAEKIDKYEPEK